MRIRSLLVMGYCLLLVPAAQAELSSKDRETARKMLEGKFYMQLDAPCIYGARAVKTGLPFDPLLQVSPTGHKMLPIPKLSESQYIYWGSSPNDPVGYGTIRVKGDTVFVWLEGRKPAANELVIEFADIKTIDDFKAAYMRTFSPVPLEELHKEWPTEIRNAIRDRRLLEGMSKEQVFCILGEPESVETKVENSVSIEIWHPRQENGDKTPYHNMKPKRTGYPTTVKFADGKLVSFEMPAKRK